MVGKQVMGKQTDTQPVEIKFNTTLSDVGTELGNLMTLVMLLPFWPILVGLEAAQFHIFSPINLLDTLIKFPRKDTFKIAELQIYQTVQQKSGEAL